MSDRDRERLSWYCFSVSQLIPGDMGGAGPGGDRETLQYLSQLEMVARKLKHQLIKQKQVRHFTGEIFILAITINYYFFFRMILGRTQQNRNNTKLLRNQNAEHYKTIK